MRGNKIGFFKYYIKKFFKSQVKAPVSGVAAMKA